MPFTPQLPNERSLYRGARSLFTYLNLNLTNAWGRLDFAVPQPQPRDEQGGGRTFLACSGYHLSAEPSLHTLEIRYLWHRAITLMNNCVVSALKHVLYRPEA